METSLELVSFSLLIGFIIFYIHQWYSGADRKYRHKCAIDRRKNRLQIRKEKADRLAKYGPPGLIEELTCGIFDSYINYAFPSLNRKK